jgi:hypothetical protein
MERYGITVASKPLNRKCIRLEIRRGYGKWPENNEDSVAKIWYSWNPVAFVWEKDRKGNRPAWIDDRQFAWYDRGAGIRHVDR